MNSALSINQSFSAPTYSVGIYSVDRNVPPHRVGSSPHGFPKRKLAIKAAASNSANSSNAAKETVSSLKAAACAVVFAAAAFGKFRVFPARAEVAAPTETIAEVLADEESSQTEDKTEASPLTQFLESNPEAIDALKKLLQVKLEAGECEESLTIIRKLSSAEPNNTEWKFMLARVLNEMGKIQEAREVFEGILAQNPFSFEALVENAMLMDKSGESEAVMSRLEEALRLAEKESKVKEARDVKMIMAQMQFLQRNVEDALRSYDELIKEDSSDFRPYFCKGVIFSLMDKNVEAREQFAKFRELSPKKFEVEGYLRTALSRMKLFGTDEEN